MLHCFKDIKFELFYIKINLKTYQKYVLLLIFKQNTCEFHNIDVKV